MKHCGTQPIETPRLLLRRFEREDQMAMYQNWAGSPIVTQYLTWEAHPSPEESLKVLCEWEKKYRKKNFYEWAIVLKEIGEPIGSIGAMPISGKSCFEVGYCIGQKWWGQGIAGEALKSVIGFLFDQVKCHRIEAKFADENIASMRVMLKAGMSPKQGRSVWANTDNGFFSCPVYEIRNNFTG